MEEITVGTKHQVVIPRKVRQRVAGFGPGRVVSVYAPDDQTVIIKVSDKSWLEYSYGALRKQMKPSSAQSVEKMRDEWNE